MSISNCSVFLAAVTDVTACVCCSDAAARGCAVGNPVPRLSLTALTCPREQESAGAASLPPRPPEVGFLQLSLLSLLS